MALSVVLVRLGLPSFLQQIFRIENQMIPNPEETELTEQEIEDAMDTDDDNEDEDDSSDDDNPNDDEADVMDSQK